jgi:phage N-6-adenine-methyltransferase
MDTSGALFSSKSDNWATPQWLSAQLDAEFGFEIDVCASPDNAKCQRYFTVDDGLTQDWKGTCWCNPPYGRAIGDLVGKACLSSLEGATVVCLVPARTDTAWWQDWAMRAHDTRFLRGRFRFGDATTSAPFPSAVLIFRAAL